MLPLIFVGIIDDQRDISYKFKFAFQFISIGFWIYLTPVETLFLYQIGFSPTLTYLLSGFWILSIINAVNMIDGMDGLAAVFGIAVCIMLFSLSGDLQNPHLILSLAGSLCGFIYWNLMPARIYLGGSGSYLIGFILSTQLLTWIPIKLDLSNGLVFLSP
jgi:UDP-GlcNAc:undecaprenyl-phosphate GlcNAc-1-phosphate transferase